MNFIPLASADLIADKALQKGRELKFAPLTVIVLDAGGQTKCNAPLDLKPSPTLFETTFLHKNGPF